MMGYGSDRGIIPLICEALFERITEKSVDGTSFNVEVSYTEIYQESALSSSLFSSFPSPR
jgi:kinesin family protein 1